MERKKRLRLFLVLAASFLALALLWRIIIQRSETRYSDLNGRSIGKIAAQAATGSGFSFLVIGDIQNSIDAFDHDMLKLINRENSDFLIMTGNSVMDGAEDKYGALYKTIEKISMPVINLVGAKEVSDRGAQSFYHHFGAFYFSFFKQDSLFVFLDTSGETAEEWQLNWLENTLKQNAQAKRIFVFMNSPLDLLGIQNKIRNEKNYKMSEAFQNRLSELFSKYDAAYVISSSPGIFREKNIGNTVYLASGGGGGSLQPGQDDSYFHYLKFNVSPDRTTFEVIPSTLTRGSSFLARAGKYIWFRIHSWAYLSLFTFGFVLLAIMLVLLPVYFRLIKKTDYYPPAHAVAVQDRKLKIAMFTDNYLPYISGVPLSIVRLSKGLRDLGHEVVIFAPKYPGYKDEEKNVVRCRLLFAFRTKKMMIPVTNIFSTRIYREFKRLKPDIVHVHHPYWLGKKGMKFARKHNIPVVFTYHTRLEQYYHYVPMFKQLVGGEIPHMIIRNFGRSCDAVIAPTDSAKAYLRNLGIGRTIEVLPTGVDLDATADAQERICELRKSLVQDGELLVFSAFRLSNEKNPYLLLQGMELLKEKGFSGFKCCIAGAGPEEENMQKYINDNKLENVKLLGKIHPQDMPFYYAAADIFVFTSLSETQGMVILEAMAGGTPVVAVESSGINDVVRDNRNGFKTAAEPEAWAEKIGILLKDSELRRRFAKNALYTAKQYSVHTIADKMRMLYDSLIAYNKNAGQ